MKTTLVMNEVVVSSELSTDDLIKIARFRPEELVKRDPETKDPIFRIGVVENGRITPYGIAFDEETNDGKAAVRMEVRGETTEDKKRFIAESFGGPLKELKEMEERLVGVAGLIEAELAEIESDITVTV